MIYRVVVSYSLDNTYIVEDVHHISGPSNSAMFVALARYKPDQRPMIISLTEITGNR